MKFFLLATSLRKDSLNKKLIQYAANIIQELDHEVDMAEFSEFNMPLYNADQMLDEGFPETVTHFIQRIHQADGIILSVPEYNYSIPGSLKNLIDWVSRVNPMPWRQQCMQLLSASPSLVGGNRGLWQTRIPLEACGAIVAPDMFSLASAHEAFHEDGKLKNAQLNQLLIKILTDFFTFTQKLK